MALLTLVTHRIPTVVVKEIIETSENLIFINDYNGDNNITKIYLNGILMGVTEDQQKFIDEMKLFRKNELLHKDISFTYDRVDNEIKIFCDEGRFTRPLFQVENNKLKITENDGTKWDDLIEKQMIQYVDNSEIEHSVVAMDEKDFEKFNSNFCEISPSMMLGVMASNIPFCDHNQCVVSTENVLMYDGSVKQIKDVKIGDRVITFNPETQKQSITKVVYTITWKTDKEVFKVTTINGRKISTTHDHPYMTNDGWKRLDEFQKDKTLLGISMEPVPVSSYVEEYNVLDSISFTKNCLERGITMKCIEKYLVELDHILPLKSTSEYLPIISRMFGFILTDCHVRNNMKSITLYFGNEYSAELFEKDVEFLGFESKVPIFFENENFGSVFQTTHGVSFTSLFIALGMLNGKKTEQVSLGIPSWIMNGSDMVKREFLGGFQGGDGSKIKNGRNDQIHVQIGSTQKTIANEYIDSMVKMMTDISKLFRELGIVVGDIKCEPSVKYPGKTLVSYFISSSRKNLIKYFDIVNYRYDVYKQSDSGVLVEYMRYLEFEYEKRVELINKIKSYGSLPRNTIAENLEISVKQVYNLGLPKGLLTFKQWAEKIIVKSTTIFLPIYSIEKIDETIVSDISVESENQSFLCGDFFCIHNSPRNIYQCLSPDTTVLMSNGERKEIKNIKVGDEVTTFCPKTMNTSITKVIHQYIRPTENKIYKITTVSGREIIATGNHNFMTSEGWIPVENMDITKTKIGICLQPKHMSNLINERVLILSKNSMIRILSNTNMKSSLIIKHANDLEELGILPLYNDFNKLEIIARIYGFTCTDGSINIYNKKNGGYSPQCQYDFCTEIDGKNFEDDIKYLGIKGCKVSEQFSEYDGSIYHTWTVSHNGCLPSLLISLGISFGKRTETIRNKIPEWIMNGTDIVKREFLSGFQGGDGCQIRWNRLKNRKSYNFVCAMTEQQINPKYKNSLEIFFSQCCDLIKYFGIEAKLSSKKIEENRIQYEYKISDKQENLIKYYDTIGYRYCYYKNLNSGKVIEYLKYKNIIVQEHIELVKNIRNDFDQGLSNRQIADKYNIKIESISDKRKSYINGRTISSPDLFNNNIEDWMDIIEDKSTSIFIPIKSIHEIENQLIADITVESENHSFIAGDNFLSSNSSMGKQAIGQFANSYQVRSDTIVHVLDYPQRPLVSTMPAKFMGFDDMPSGINAIVAIMCYTGFFL